jgi:hypothetical protein
MERRPWILLWAWSIVAAALGCYLAGEVLPVIHPTESFPSLADLWFLAF